MTNYSEPDNPRLRVNLDLAKCEYEWSDVLGLVHKTPPVRDWRSNTGYGLMDVYIDAAGLPLDYRPHINILHAQFICMADHWYHSSEAGFRSVPAIFVHNEEDKRCLQDNVGENKRVLLASHPFHYVIQHYSEFDLEVDRSGSVFFLPHTLGQPAPRVPIDYVIKRLRALPENYHPIDVCLHVNDISKELIAKFESYGFSIVSAGHRHDPAFLHRFYWLCRRRKKAIMIDHGTQLWLSSLAGCEVCMLPDIPEILWVPANNSFDWLVVPKRHYWPLLDLIKSPEINQVALNRMIFTLTGGNHILSSEELRSLFQRAENWYISWRDHHGGWCVSPQYCVLLDVGKRRFRALHAAVTNRISGRRGRYQPFNYGILYDLIAYQRASDESNDRES